jgi:TonB family protein
MMNYLLELAAIHIILVVGYWILLRKERQFGFMRMSLVVITLASLIIPLIALPQLFPSDSPSISSFTLDLTLMDISLKMNTTSASAPPSEFGINHLMIFAYLTISGFFLFRFSKAIFEVWHIRNRSASFMQDGCKVYKFKNLNGSFSFLNSIFIDKKLESDPAAYKAILLHELAHVKYKHSYEVIFFELYKICFWWLPTSWLVLHEIKKIHEFQADADAVKHFDIHRYSSILINSTLKMNGLSIINSFNQIFIQKRLQVMKNKIQKIEPLKILAMASLILLLFVVFACSEESNNLSKLDNSIQGNHASSSIESIPLIVEKLPEYEGGKKAFIAAIESQIEYPGQALQNGVQGHVFVKFTVQKDGAISSIKTVRSTIKERYPGLGGECEVEAHQAISNLQRFTPCIYNGEPIETDMIVPITFTMSERVLKEIATNKKGVVEAYAPHTLGIKLNVNFQRNGEMLEGTVFDDFGKTIEGALVSTGSENEGLLITDKNGKFQFKDLSQIDDIKNPVAYKDVITH